MLRTQTTILVCSLSLGLLLWAVACNGRDPTDDLLLENPDIIPPSDQAVDGERLIHPVPKPLDLLLPKAISIHPFTGTQTDNAKGGNKAIEARIKALDGFGDPTKAFGRFRFSLHVYRRYSVNQKGKRLAAWEEQLLEPEKNRRHWDPISQTYKFNLQWDQALTPGTQYVLEVYFISPFTEQLFDERVFVAGKYAHQDKGAP